MVVEAEALGGDDASRSLGFVGESGVNEGDITAAANLLRSAQVERDIRQERVFVLAALAGTYGAMGADTHVRDMSLADYDLYRETKASALLAQTGFRLDECRRIIDVFVRHHGLSKHVSRGVGAKLLPF